jgi:hypothetical protein
MERDNGIAETMGTSHHTSRARETTAIEYYCPYDGCEFDAPTERQVRSHISLASHDKHEEVSGFTIGIDVPGSDGGTYSYENKNKVNLTDVESADITSEVSVGKQQVLKIAYENPDKNYTEIRELAANEDVALSYNVVRRLIRTHIEAVPPETSSASSNAQSSEEVADRSVSHAGSYAATDRRPFTASPDIDLKSNERADEQTDDTIESQSRKESAGQNTAAHSTTPQTRQQEAHQTNTPPSTFPYDTSHIPDYWNETRQRIIATYEALDDPTPIEVHTELSDTLGYDIDVSVVLNVLNGWSKNEYAELTETQQRAIDAMADKNEDETLADVAKRYDVAEGTIKYVRYTFTHILTDEGVPAPGTN